MSRSADGLRVTAGLFLKLGFLAFGGPSAHIAMLEDEVVTRRRWMSRQHFLDLVGATNLIPGPNSTEMMLHVGLERHGWRGQATAGACFILPAALLTAACAWLYVRYGTLPEVLPLLAGIKPAILAVILAAIWRLGKTAIKGWRYAVIGVGVAAAVLAGLDELAALALGALGGALFLALPRGESWGGGGMAMLLPLLQPGASPGTAADGVSAAGLWKLAAFFLKVGSVLYGSGYVLIAFIEGGLVEHHGWLSQDQLLDAVAVGQLTPGPVLSTATFVGYLVAGGAGAAVATVAIFLPSFLFVLILNPLVPRLRRNPWTARFLDAVNVTAVGLMAAVTVRLGAATLTSWPAWAIALLAAVAVLALRIHAAWLVVGGAILGYLFELTVGFG